jgi:carbamate kinase
LGVLVAATAGWIGYMIQQSLENALVRAGMTRDVATVITQVQVDPSDPAMRKPTKFIGRPVTPERAAEMKIEGPHRKKRTDMVTCDASSVVRRRKRSVSYR